MCALAPGFHIYLSPVQDGRRPGSTGSRSAGQTTRHPIATATARQGRPVPCLAGPPTRPSSGPVARERRRD